MSDPIRLRRRSAGGVAVALVAAAALAGCSTASSGSASAGYTQVATGITVIAAAHRPTAPALSGTSLEGRQLSLAGYRGDVVFVNVWGSWCTQCRIEGPALEETYQKYQSRGVKFIGIDTQDNDAAARAFESSIGVTYPSLPDPDEVLLLQFKSILPSTVVPSSAIIDRNGKVAVRILGAVTEPQLVQQLDAVLGEH